MTSRAQLSQERSRQRREALLNAALDLFVEGGSRAVTHRAVAAAAGLPAATTTYYFATIDELLREALTHHIDGWLATMEGLADVDVTGLVALITEDSSVRFAGNVFDQRPPTTATRELAVILGAARDPELREAAVTALTTATDVLVGVLNRGGIEDAEGLAEDMVAVVAGVALRRSAAVNTEAEEAANVVRALRHLIVGHLTGAEAGTQMLAAHREQVLSGRSAASP
ncbi:TetR family transcriptional regulator [Aeromicrobium flavum]|uniref:TetR family transcriptional regulator n=1 Tax=Aeromicrobium flavum TaxID=416568 RepID=A0A512HTE1_9ACTN|nr:TetR family transcriptional regulator [Aeromicrobium flavum]GEO88722.1 TetR family transcriptional regulator [Aeromicrobium flavum]